MEEKKKGGKTGLVVILSIVIGVLIAFIAFAVFFIGFLISEDDNTDNQSTKATTTTADESKKVSYTFDDGSSFSFSLTEKDNVVVTVVGSNKERASLIYAGLMYNMSDIYNSSKTVTETVGYIEDLELKGVFTVIHLGGKATGTIPSWCNIDENNTTLSKRELSEYINHIESGVEEFKKLIN